MRLNQEIKVSAAAVGFFLPRYRFSTSRVQLVRFGWEGRIPLDILGGLQEEREASEEAAWSWFPEKAGFFRIHVDVEDLQEKASADRLYRVLPLEQPNVNKAGESEEAPPVKKKTPDSKKEKHHAEG